MNASCCTGQPWEGAICWWRSFWKGHRSSWRQPMIPMLHRWFWPLWEAIWAPFGCWWPEELTWTTRTGRDIPRCSMPAPRGISRLVGWHWWTLNSYSCMALHTGTWTEFSRTKSLAINCPYLFAFRIWWQKLIWNCIAYLYQFYVKAEPLTNTNL